MDKLNVSLCSRSSDSECSPVKRPASTVRDFLTVLFESTHIHLKQNRRSYEIPCSGFEQPATEEGLS